MDPLAEDVKNLIGYELNLMHGTLMNDFTEQLYDYLKSYTSGEIQSQVISGGREKSWETWRVLCDQGKSRRKLEVHEDYKRLMNPPQYPLETLLKGIAQWERDLLTYTAANDDKGLEPETKKLCLENMCPEALQEHLLDKYEQGLIKTYDQYKQAVSTYVYRKTKRGKSNGTKKQNIHGLFGADEGSEEEPHDENCDGWENQVNELTQQAEKIAGQLNALVKGSGKFAKRPKGFGKGAKAGKGAGNGAAPMEVDHSDKDCYHCGEHGHIARNCPKGKGKGDKGGKDGRGGKDGKGGKAGKGPWQPSLQTWKYMYPGPSPAQWTEWWKQYSATPATPSPYKGRANLFEQGNRLSAFQTQQESWDNWKWPQPGSSPGNWQQPSGPPSSQQALNALFSGGNMYKFVEKGPKPKVVETNDASFKSYNKFEALGETDEDERVGRRDRWPRGARVIEPTPIESLIKPPSRNKERKAARVEAEANKEAPSEPTKVAPLGLMVLRELQKVEKLAPMMRRERPTAPNGWEVLSAIVDSGASITAVHPEDGKAYKVEESEGSKNKVMYETAGDEDLPNLGQKRMAVLTPEVTLRGFESQCAKVSAPLESVRQLLKSKHCVLFGLGENEDEHLIVNKLTGEVNRMRDDGINYLHDLLIVPPDEVAKVQQTIEQGASPFGRQGEAQ